MRRILCILFTVVLLIIPAQAAIAQYDASDLTVTYTVAEDGSYTASASLNLAFSSADTSLQLPLGTSVQSASCSGYRTSLSTAKDGTVWLTISTGTGFLLPGSYSITWSGDLTYETDPDANTTEVTLDLLCAQWPGTVSNINFSIALPSDQALTNLQLTSGYYGELSGDAVTLTQETASITGSVSSQLLDHESLTLSFTAPNQYFKTPPAILTAFSFSGLVVPILCVLLLAYWFMTLRSPRTSCRTQMVPPDGVCAGDVPYLMFGNRPAAHLTILQWASLGYLTFFNTRSGVVALERSMGMGNERKPYERKLFLSIFSHAFTISAAETNLRRQCESIEKPLAGHWRRRIFDRSSGSPGLLQFGAALCCAISGFRMGIAFNGVLLGLLLAIVCLFAGLLIVYGVLLFRRRTSRVITICAVAALCAMLLASNFAGIRFGMLLSCIVCCFAGFVTAHGGLRTSAGNDLLARLRSLRRFLTSAEPKQLKRLLHQDPQYFYRMLPFAEALGVGKAFANRFGTMRMEPCEWYRTGETNPITAPEFYAEFRTAVNAMRGKSKK